MKAAGLVCRSLTLHHWSQCRAFQAPAGKNAQFIFLQKYVHLNFLTRWTGFFCAYTMFQRHWWGVHANSCSRSDCTYQWQAETSPSCLDVRAQPVVTVWDGCQSLDASVYIQAGTSISNPWFCKYIPNIHGSSQPVIALHRAVAAVHTHKKLFILGSGIQSIHIIACVEKAYIS